MDVTPELRPRVTSRARRYSSRDVEPVNGLTHFDEQGLALDYPAGWRTFHAPHPRAALNPRHDSVVSGVSRWQTGDMNIRGLSDI